VPITVGHAKVVTVPDSTDTGIVRPSDWNSLHVVSFDAGSNELIKWASAGANSISSGTLQFSNQNGLTFGMDPAGVVTASHNGLTTAALSDHSHGNPTLALTNLSGTTASASNGFTLSLSAGAGGAGDGYNILAAGTQTANTTGTVLFNNGGGVTFGMSNNSVITATVATNYQSQGAYLTTAALSDHSHGNPTLALTNLSGTTASNSAGLTLSLSAAAPGAGGGIAAAAGTQTATSGTVLFNNSNGITFGMSNSSVITASHNGLTTAAQSDHSHGNPTLALTNLSGTTASASNGFTLSLSAAAPGGGAGIDRQYHEIMEGDLLTHCCSITGASFSKRPILVPFWMDGSQLSCKSIQFWASRAGGTTLNMTAGIAFYSMANSTQLTLAASATQAYSMTTSALFSGVRRYEFTQLSSFTLSEGRWIAAMYFSGSNNSTAVANLVIYGGQTMFPVNGLVYAGSNSSGATSGSDHVVPWWGVYSNTTGAFPNSIGRNQVSGQGSNNVNADIYMMIKEI